MAMNIYGSEVSEETVKRQPDYDPTKPITRHDVAKLGLKMINDEEKRDRARAYLDVLAEAEDYVKSDSAATKCFIYNATGETMIFNSNEEWSGYIRQSKYPQEIKNGQWGVFFHYTPSHIWVPSRSHGVVAYSLKDQDLDSELYCVLSWLTGLGSDGNNCYAQMSSYVNTHVFTSVFGTMFTTWKDQYIVEHGLLQAEVTIGDESMISEWTAIIKLLP